ncbi:MAG: phage terminase large subunit [Isosphaeraceae bacterium]|nr:phage terminase large subunit [Isosphaeraceae bacterium]
MPPQADEQLMREHARAEAERRRRARLREFPSYGDWLPLASPEFCWSYTWLRHVQGYYDQVTAGLIRKLMVFAPPQHGKSEGGTIRYPVYRMEREPKTRVIIAAHSQNLANKFSRKARKIASQRFKLSRERKSVGEWDTAAGGSLRAVGVGGSIAGTPGDLIFIDDPVKNRKAANSPLIRETVWEWYCDDIVTRCQESGAIVLQMTRWHEDDLAGRILASEDGPNWTVIKLPALAEENDPLGRAIGEALCPERFSRQTLENRRTVLRNSFWALFQQSPRPKEGGFFKREWFKHIIDRLPEDDPVVARVRWWDCAATDADGDWTVGVRMARTKSGKFIVEDVVRGQWESGKRDSIIRKTAESDPKGTKFWREQEPGSSGVDAAKAFVRLLVGYAAQYATSTGSKEDRADAYASQLSIGNVWLLRGAWVPRFIEEHCEFPTGSHDDQVDASAGAFNQLARGRKFEVS